MDYYHNLITEKSFQELKNLKKITDFILIGGWAVYFYTKMLKSKDIDIIIRFDQLPVFAKNYELIKNERLKKYEARKQEIQIDIYLPHYSFLGIPVEDLITKTKNLAGFTLLDANYLFLLKLYVLSLRGRSVKGRKDMLDILSLIISDSIEPDEIKNYLKEFSLTKYWDNLENLLAEMTKVPELNLNPHQLARLKKKLS